MTVARILERKGYRVFSVSETAPISEVIHMLAENRIGVLVVTNAEGDAVGIVSERDVVAALDADRNSRRTAAELMTRTLVKCSPDDTEGDVMERMGKAGVRHLPVYHGKKLVGLVSARDLLNLRIEKLSELMAEIRTEAARQAPAF